MIIPSTAKRFAASQISPETKRAYLRDLTVFFRFMADNRIDVIYNDFTEEEITSFRDYLVESFAPNGAGRVWSTIRSYLKWTDASTALRRFQRVKAPKRVRNTAPVVPSDKDVQALVRAAATNSGDTLVIALLLNGLRASEVCAMRTIDVEYHYDRDVGGVILRVLGKGMKERLIPATVETEKAITQFQARNHHLVTRSEYLVPSNYDGRQRNYRQIEHTIYKYNIPGMHPHALRHHYATRLIRAGVSVLHVQRLLGHSDVSTTQRYVTLDLRDLIEAARKDPMNKAPELTVVPVVPAIAWEHDPWEEVLDPWEEGADSFVPVAQFSFTA